eukprot:sb/3468734/
MLQGLPWLTWFMELFTTIIFLTAEATFYRILPSSNPSLYAYNKPLFPAVCNAYNTSEAGLGLDASEWGLWSVNTVPLYIILLVFPLCCLKSATVLSKFNSLGVICILFAITFVVTKGALWGVNITIFDALSPHYIAPASVDFNKLAGTLTLSFFIHNAIVALIRNNENPKNNARDTSLAFLMVALTYGLVGGLFLITYPLHKSCIADVPSQLQARGIVQCTGIIAVYPNCHRLPQGQHRYQYQYWSLIGC